MPASPGLEVRPSAAASAGSPTTGPSLAVVAPAPPPEDGGPAFTDPPALEPQADAVCLDVLSRDAAEAALGRVLGDIVAEATEPSVQLTCRFAVGSGNAALR